ncbi:MAG: hypothetical protein ACK4Q5_13195 [Saprospiraceae bacterium]
MIGNLYTSPNFKTLFVSAAIFLLKTAPLEAQCTGLGSVTFTILAPPEPTLTFDNQICPGQTSTIEVNETFSDYEWSTGESGPAITVDDIGTYTVTVTNAAGCSATAAATITQTAGLNVTATAQPYDCDGTLTITASGSFASYEWDTGETGASITVSSDGTYTVTATDASGCTGSATFNANIPEDPQVDIDGDFSICGSGNTTLTATPGFQNYQWSGGFGSGNIRTVNAPGDYTVTVSNNLGCTDTETVTVSQAPNAAPTLDFPDPICVGEFAQIFVTNGPFDAYEWSNGDDSPSIVVGTAGNYTVTVTDANGCTGTASTALTVNPNPTVSIDDAPYDCDGLQVLNASGSFPNYEWSTGESSQSITVSSDGTFTVTVTNATGCTGTASFAVNIPPAPEVEITGDFVFCENDNTLLTATPGFQNYQWSGGTGSGNTRTVSVAGNYTVTATDVFGCTDTETVSVDEQPAPAPQLNAPAPICAGETAEIEVLNAIFQTYQWSSGGNGSSITVLNTGTYTVTVTDAAGCTGTDAASLIVLPNPNASINQLPYNCDGQLILSATPGFQNYQWSTGASGATTVVTQSGTYFVAVTGANGCTTVALVDADIPPAPFVNITGITSICEGENSILDATPGFDTYDWSTGETSTSISVDASGTYFVTVTDGFGCTATASESLDVNPAPEPQITGPTQICASGTAIFSATGGTFVTYAWSSGSQTPTITVANAGTYRLTVTDAAGCTGTDAVTLTIGNSLDIQIAEQPYQCNGQITLDAGAGFQTYAWSNGGNTATISTSTNGNFTVTVTDATGCTGTANATVNIPDAPQVEVTGAPEICQGTSTVLAATPGFGVYEWSNGQLNPSISVGTAGTFTVTVTDGEGCTATANFALAVVAAPVPVIAGTATICENSSATLSAPGGFQTFNWSTGASTPTIQASTAGTYAVTVSNAAGCTGTDDFILNVNTSLQPTISPQPYACDGQITLDAGAGFQNYSWSDGGNTQTINALQSGDFAVTVSDANGCTGTATIAVQIPAQPQVAVSGNPSFCAGDATVVFATAGFQNYAWASGSAAAQITVSQTGNYTVTATDANGCTSSASFAVVENPLPLPQILGSTTLCNGGATTLSASQIFPRYEWSTGETTAQISISQPGAVGLTVTDANGCTGSTTVNLTVATSLSPQITPQPYACDGQIVLDAGAGFQNYNWSNGGNSQTINALQSGDFAVTVSDANGCTGTATIAVQIPAQPQVAVSGNPSFCAGDATAVFATTGFQNYAWSSGSNSQTITVSQAGNFTVTATDANGCTSSASFAVAENPLPQPQILGSTTLCNGGATTLSASQIFPRYEWSTGETTAQISINQPGAVGLTVTDANGCVGSTAVNLTVATSLSPQITPQPYVCDGQITLDAGAGFQNYSWSDGGNTQTINALQSGDFAVTVSDANGCTGTATIAVQIPAQPQVAVSGNLIFCPGSSTTLTATAGFPKYEWSNGAATAEITVSQAGVFAVTATDGLGCTATASVPVSEKIVVQPQILGSSVICVGSSTVLSVSNAASFLQFIWSDGTAAAQITVAAAGDYSVTATDATGCTASASFAVTVGNTLAPMIDEGVYQCDQKITLEAPTGFVNYMWSNGSGGATISVSSDGNYSLTVTDATGCTGTASVFVEVPDEVLVVVQTPPTPICPGGSASLSVPPGLAGYAWSSGETVNAIQISAAGIYGVTVTDIYGCTATDEYEFKFAELPQLEINGQPLIDCEVTEAKLSANVLSTVGVAKTEWSNGELGSEISVTTAGNFTVTVTDVNGCSATAAVEVLKNTSYDTFADTLEFVPGQVLTLTPPLPNFSPVETSWSPVSILDCNDCLENKARPTEDVRVNFSVQALGDCSLEGYFYLFTKVKKKPEVFAPNAILIDDGANGVFTLYGNDLALKINYLRVYTRWGELVDEFYDLTPGDVSQGWRGQFRGKPVDVGVFVWVAEVLFTDGTTEIFKGDVTVFR